MSQSLITSAPAVITVSGKTAVERKLSAMRQGDAATVAALCNASGAIGKAARAGVAAGGLVGLASRASKNNYAPIAAYIGAVLGCSFVISNRASFESVPDRLEAAIMDAKNTKSGGYREDKKTGAQVPNAKLAALLKLKAEFVEMVAQAEAIRSGEVRQAIEA